MRNELYNVIYGFFILSSFWRKCCETKFDVLVLVSCKNVFRKVDLWEIKNQFQVGNMFQTGSTAIDINLKFTIAKRPFHHSSSDISKLNLFLTI